jgi:ATPase subunit of ABC transporter with duplicated ATPase domains
VIVSHDREFLARTVNRIVELDLAQQQVGVYDGGYDSYLAERAVARRHAREAYEEYDDKLGGLKDRAQMQRNWMATGVRNAAASPPTTTSSAARPAPRPARSRPRRPARPSA